MIDLIFKYGTKLLRFVLNLFKDIVSAGAEEVKEIREMLSDVSPKRIAHDVVNEGTRFFGTALLLEGLKKYPTSFLTKAKPYVNLPYEDCIDGTEIRPLLLTWRLSQQLFYKYAYNMDAVRMTLNVGI